MKRSLGKLEYVITFTVVEVLIFAMLYAIYGWAMRYGVTSVVSGVLGSVVWRVITLQIVFQVVFLSLMLRYEIREFVAVLMSTFLAYSIACILSTSSVSTIWKLLHYPTKFAMGEGFALLFSTLIAYGLFSSVSFAVNRWID